MTHTLPALVESSVELRERVTSSMKAYLPEFSLPDCVELSLDELSGENLRLALRFPATANSEGERAGFVYELYESFAYLLGKGHYESHDDSSDESMVWLVPKSQEIAQAWTP